jgi:pimeloyl-ACP methyl ester carboxylesterase
VVVGGLAALAVIGGASAPAGADIAASAPVPAFHTPDPLSGPAAFDPEFTNGTVAYNGGFLHFVRGGSGPVLVLLHGWPENWSEFEKIMPALAKTHTVVALDMPGMGSSSIPVGGYDSKTLAARIDQAVHNLGYGTVAVLAHDMGNIEAYDWARDYPNDVSRLLAAEAPLPGFGLEAAYQLSFHFLLNGAPAPVADAIITNHNEGVYLSYLIGLAEHVPGAVDKDRYIDAYRDPARRTAADNYYRAFPQDSADNKANAAAKRLTMPVLAMGGQFFFGTGVAASFQQVANDVRTVVAPGSAHFIPEENPQFMIDCANLFFGPAGVTPPTADLAGCAA